MATEKSQKVDSPKAKQITWYRVALTILISLTVIAYIMGVVLGYIPEERRIDAVHLTIIVLAALGITLLLRPDLFNRLKRLETSIVNVELFEVKQELEHQRNELNNIAMLLPLLFPATERKHLLNLYEGKTAGYEGKSSLRAELRRLRSIDLIRMRPDRPVHVEDITNGLIVDLADYVELTERGEYWAKRIEEITKGETAEDVETNEHD